MTTNTEIERAAEHTLAHIDLADLPTGYGCHSLPLSIIEDSTRYRCGWEAWLTAQKAKHAAHTARIVAAETALNARVYALFGLTPDEIKVTEDSTEYRYGEV